MYKELYDKGNSFLKIVLQGGPQGIMMIMDGKPVDISRWRCQTVSKPE